MRNPDFYYSSTKGWIKTCSECLRKRKEKRERLLRNEELSSVEGNDEDKVIPRKRVKSNSNASESKEESSSSVSESTPRVLNEYTPPSTALPTNSITPDQLLYHPIHYPFLHQQHQV